jgi:NADPH-dependent curcumin reductase CurA
MKKQVACGSVSQSSLPRDKVYGLKNIGNVVAKRIRMQGFIVFDENMGPKYEKERDEKVTSVSYLLHI